ncbi:hypothetical protein VTO42DRAFT_7073 [Malbranchea cinnamomea]
MGSRLEAGSNATRKRIENHVFEDEDGEEYGESSFGGFGDYFRRKKIKLQNLDAEIRASSPNKPPIFRGVVAHVNGYTQPSLNDLHRLIVSHGGGFLQYLDSKTAATHIIASSLTPKKREEFRKYRIVKPAWVVDSVKAGRLLPWDAYRTIDEGPSQKRLAFGSDRRITAQSRSPSTGYRDQTDSSWYTSQLRQSADDGQSTESPDVSVAAAGRRDPPAIDAPRPTTVPPEVNAGARAGSDGLDEISIPEDVVGTEQKTNDSRPLSAPASPASPANAKPNPPPQTGNTGRRGSSEMTPEEYNAQLLRKSEMRNSSVLNPEFIQQYYRESRLHHLSTWKAELKAQLQAAARERASSRHLQTKRAPGARRYILHVDFDSFFAAVSLRKHPELEDKPVAIAHGTGPSSEIASCNYPARAFGIRNGMWMKGALELCPGLKVLPYDFVAYEEASRKFYEAILDTDGVVQSVSIDEALVDITTQCLEAGGSDGRGVSEGSIYREQAKADSVAQGLRDSIKEKTGCNVSVGIGGNILQAKLALRKAKPAGQFQLKPEAVLDYIGSLTVQELPGVAYSLGAKLEELGVKYVKDIRELTKERLIAHLGPKTGAKLWDYARGVDHTEVGEQGVRKSVSAEINWGIRFVTQAQAEEFVQSLCDELHRRLVENAVKGKQLTMRIMRRSPDAPLEPPKHLGHGKCDTFNRSVALGVATNARDVLGREAISILRSFNFSPGDLRGIGVQMTKLEPVKQTATGEPQSSQKQLQFKPASPRPKRAERPDPDEIESPQKGDASTRDVSDRIKMAPPLNDASQKPLNITGTQFIMPSQVDPTVLAELPGDIRSKLVDKPKQPTIESTGVLLSPGRPATPRSQSPLVPPLSQLDPEALAALPDDIRAEVLAFYEEQPPSDSTTAPPPPPPSNSRPNPPPPPKVTTPSKSRSGKKRGRTAGPRSGTGSRLVQSSFLFPTRPSASTGREAASNSAVLDADLDEGIAQDVLEALPEDIRREVLEEHRRSRLQKKAGLSLPPIFRRRAPEAPSRPPPEQRTLKLPPRPAKPTFTSKKLSALPELRDALSQWYDEFRDDGPFEEDVMALSKYLRRVVVEERDIAKAVAVANWLAWLLREDSSSSSSLPVPEQGVDGPSASRDSWRRALETVRGEVSGAVEERGLAPVEFS